MSGLSWLRRALTRKVTVPDRSGRGRRAQVFVVEPDERLVYGVRFAIGAIGFLSAVEVGSMAFLYAWNSEVFASISGLVGLVTGILISAKN